MKPFRSSCTVSSSAPFVPASARFDRFRPVGVKVLSGYRRVPRLALRPAGADGARCIEIDDCFPERDASTRARVRFAVAREAFAPRFARRDEAFHDASIRFGGSECFDSTTSVVFSPTIPGPDL